MTNTIANAVSARQAAEDAGVAELNKLREREAEILARTETERQAIAAERAAVEEAFGQEEAARRHAEQLNAARTRRAEARANHTSTAAAAAGTSTTYLASITAVSNSYQAAVTAALAHHEAAQEDHDAWAAMNTLDPTAAGAEPTMPTLASQLWQRQLGVPYLAAQAIGAHAHPELEPRVRQLSGSGYRTLPINLR